jgi:signal transduction histidine kinase
MSAWTKQFEQRPKGFFVTASLVVVGVVGVVDYFTGYTIFFSAFYLLAVALAAWFVGGPFAIVISFLSVGVWLGGDIAAGAHYKNVFVPIWNGAIALTVYYVVVRTLTSLHRLHKELEERVRQRTMALTGEIHERERLEKEILEIQEREQRRIGSDLHDSLCQYLTATAMAAQVLGEKLSAKSVPEIADAREVVRLVENSISLTRDLARGISPVEIEMEGLIIALREFATNISRLFKVNCAFDCDSPPMISDVATATHLYRIMQEAVNNAIRHGKPKQIVISLSNRKKHIELTIEDDGAGLPEDWQKGRGLGTRIMARRAAMMGGMFSIEPNPTGGTFVKCSIPAAA